MQLFYCYLNNNVTIILTFILISSISVNNSTSFWKPSHISCTYCRTFYYTECSVRILWFRFSVNIIFWIHPKAYVFHSGHVMSTPQSYLNAAKLHIFIQTFYSWWVFTLVNGLHLTILLSKLSLIPRFHIYQIHCMHTFSVCSLCIKCKVAVIS